jgi:hypothetical protein
MANGRVKCHRQISVISDCPQRDHGFGAVFAWITTIR